MNLLETGLNMLTRNERIINDSEQTILSSLSMQNSSYIDKEVTIACPLASVVAKKI